MIQIPQSQVEAVLRKTAGRFFTVIFIKRTDGTARTMNCRTGVVKHLKGGVPAYDAKSKNLLVVFDVNASGYRSIPLENVKEIHFGGEKFHVIPN